MSGALYCSRAVLPGMLRRGEGVILNLSSMWGQVGGSCEVAYSATKAALIGMTKALAKEVVILRALYAHLEGGSLARSYETDDEDVLAFINSLK